MTRRSTAVLSALEALLVVALGIGVPLVMLTVLWATQFGFQVDWLVFWRAAVVIWLLGHGVDVTLQLDPATVAALGVAEAGEPILITIALSGFLLVTALAGVGLGKRLREQPHRILGELVAVSVVVVLSLLVTLSAAHPAALPSRWQGALFPGLVFGLGVAIGSIGATNPARVKLRRMIADGPQPWLAAAGVGLRAGLGTIASIMIAASLLTAVALVASYGQVIALYESLQAEVLGGIALTLGQLALLPTIVVWAAAWLIGPGFAVGAGSAVSPIAVSLGPLPALPVLGALPQEPSPLGFITVLVPVLAAFAAGVALRPRLAAAWHEHADAPGPLAAWSFGSALLAALVAALGMAFVSFVASGAAGPGRLAEVGPDPVTVGLWMLGETFLGVALGLLAGGARRSSGSRGG